MSIQKYRESLFRINRVENLFIERPLALIILLHYPSRLHTTMSHQGGSAAGYAEKQGIRGYYAILPSH